MVRHTSVQVFAALLAGFPTLTLILRFESSVVS
jgi:hypothetical protein